MTHTWASRTPSKHALEQEVSSCRLTLRTPSCSASYWTTFRTASSGWERRGSSLTKGLCFATLRQTLTFSMFLWSLRRSREIASYGTQTDSCTRLRTVLWLCLRSAREVNLTVVLSLQRKLKNVGLSNLNFENHVEHTDMRTVTTDIPQANFLYNFNVQDLRAKRLFVADLFSPCRQGRSSWRVSTSWRSPCSAGWQVGNGLPSAKYEEL